MDDLISRQLVMKTLCERSCGNEPKGCPAGFCPDSLAVDCIPSAQPEIVMCKDCKHRDAENGFCEGRGWPMQLVPDDGFCDKGERSEE